jgi:hypothetical protein
MGKTAYDYFLESEDKEQFIIDKTIEWNLPDGDLAKILILMCKDKKKNDYPRIEDQLDLLWHDIDNGILGESAKDSSWYNSIKETKQKYPKPE